MPFYNKRVIFHDQWEYWPQKWCDHDGKIFFLSCMIFRDNADWLRVTDNESNRPFKCRNNMIMMAQFFSLSRMQAYMYVKGSAICQAKGFHFAMKPPACGSWVLNRTFDIIQVIWCHWSFWGITHDFVNVVSFRSISVCLILVAPWKVKVLMWPTCLSWKMVLLTCRWDKVNAFLFTSKFFLVTWETVVFNLLYWTVVS